MFRNKIGFVKYEHENCSGYFPFMVENSADFDAQEIYDWANRFSYNPTGLIASIKKRFEENPILYQYEIYRFDSGVVFDVKIPKIVLQSKETVKQYLLTAGYKIKFPVMWWQFEQQHLMRDLV